MGLGYGKIILLVLLCGLHVGCTRGTNPVVGRITPAHFDFQTTVPITTPGADGWQAVCIHARITHGNTGTTDVCRFEVGLPLRNELNGDIIREEAQRTSARMANWAAHEVLSKAAEGEPIALLCLKFKRRYQVLLKEKIAGARVSECVSGLKPVYFDIPEVRP